MILTTLRAARGLSLSPATPVLAVCLPLFSFSLYFFASSRPPSLISPSISLRHAHQYSQVGTFKGQWCVQSDSGKGPPLPNQSTYLIRLSQGLGLINYSEEKTEENQTGGGGVGQERRNKEMQDRKEKGKRLELEK